MCLFLLVFNVPTPKWTIWNLTLNEGLFLWTKFITKSIYFLFVEDVVNISLHLNFVSSSPVQFLADPSSPPPGTYLNFSQLFSQTCFFGVEPYWTKNHFIFCENCFSFKTKLFKFWGLTQTVPNPLPILIYQSFRSIR